MESTYVPRLKEKYLKEVVPALMQQFQYKNIMQVPKITKVVLNQGVKGAVSDKRLIDTAVQELTLISGQKAVPTRAKKDISNFKLRKGMPVGVRVTLRGIIMYEFLDRLLTIALPRIRDFKGVSAKGFDGRGNYNLGVPEQIIFPEIDIDKVSKINGLDITIVTTAPTDEEAYALLKEMGMPFNAPFKAKKQSV